MLNNYKRFLLLFVFILIILPSAFAAPSRDQADRELVIYGIRGPSGLGIVRLFEDPPQAPGFSIRAEALAQADLIAARFIAGEAKIGILPPNVAAKIASSGNKIQAAAVVGMGMLSLVTSDPEVKSIADLRGKTVEAANQGTSPDYVFRTVLINNGLKPDTDVRLGFSLAYPEITQSIIAGRISTSLMPEPFATQALAANSSLRRVGDIQQEWGRITGGGNFPMTVLAVDGDFAAANREVVNIILSAIEKSINWTVSNPEEAGRLAEKFDLGFPSKAASEAVPRSNYVFIPAQQARVSLENLFGVFLEYSPVSIGGGLPKDNFYLK